MNLLKQILLFILSPLLAFFVAIRSWWKNSSQLIIFLFICWFAFVMTPNSDSKDLYAYLFSLQKVDFRSFTSIYQSFINGNIEDVYLPVAQLVTLQFTNDGHYLLLLCGLTLGGLFIVSLRQFDKGKTFEYFIFVLAFCFVVGIDRLGGIRNIIAFYFLFDMVILYAKTGKVKYAVCSTFVLLFHYSTILYLVVFLLSIFFKGHKRLLITLLLLSVVFSVLSDALQVLNINTNIFGLAIQNKIEAYTTGSIFERMSEQLSQSFFVRYKVVMLRYMAILIVIYLYYLKVKNLQSSLLWSFIVMMLVLCNFVSSIPNLSEWANMYCFSFLVFLLYSIWNLIPRSSKTILYCLLSSGLILHLLYTLIQISQVIVLDYLLFSPVFYSPARII